MTPHPINPTLHATASPATSSPVLTATGLGAGSGGSSSGGGGSGFNPNPNQGGGSSSTGPSSDAQRPIIIKVKRGRFRTWVVRFARTVLVTVLAGGGYIVYREFGDLFPFLVTRSTDPQELERASISLLHLLTLTFVVVFHILPPRLLCAVFLSLNNRLICQSTPSSTTTSRSC